MPFTIAIVGCPNVGKSTLYNRIIGKKHAITEDTPGVTRDWRLGNGQIGDIACQMMDTAGFEDTDPTSLEGRMFDHTSKALHQAQLIFFVVDGSVGVTPQDEEFARWLHRYETPCLLLINKSDKRHFDSHDQSFYKLGFGTGIPVAATHGHGLDLLYEAVQPLADRWMEENPDADSKDERDKPIHVAIVGRPNAGKSTLLNQLINEERVLTGPEAGITRDSIAVEWEFHGRRVKLVDTAGIRKRKKVSSGLEKLSLKETFHAIDLAQVVILLMDMHSPFDSQDITIAERVIAEGRALVLAVNKCDIHEYLDDKKRAIRKWADDRLPNLDGIPMTFISAKEGHQIGQMIRSVVEMYDIWNKRISTAKLNDWLRHTLDQHQLPLASDGRRVRIKYITQAKTRPPSFILFSTRPKEVPDSYMRYLRNQLRKDFHLPGVPLRLTLRKGENPYSS